MKHFLETYAATFQAADLLSAISSRERITRDEAETLVKHLTTASSEARAVLRAVKRQPEPKRGE